MGGCEPLQALLGGPEAPLPVTHTVEKGDTLSAIARRYGVTLDELRQANDLSGDLIEIGQVLVIPGATEPTAGTPSGKKKGSRTAQAPAGGTAAPPVAGLKLPPEQPCLSGPTDAELAGDEPGMVGSAGLERAQVKAAMDAFLGRLSPCAEAEPSWPVGTARLEITVACTGRVASVQVEDSGGLSASLLGCVQQTLRYAPFPAHDMPDGYTFAYPLRFSAP